MSLCLGSFEGSSPASTLHQSSMWTSLKVKIWSSCRDETLQNVDSGFGAKSVVSPFLWRTHNRRFRPSTGVPSSGIWPLRCLSQCLCCSLPCLFWPAPACQRALGQAPGRIQSIGFQLCKNMCTIYILYIYNACACVRTYVWMYTLILQALRYLGCSNLIARRIIWQWHFWPLY